MSVLTRLAPGVLFIALLSTGCMTFASGNLPRIAAEAPAQPGSVEYTVGAFMNEQSWVGTKEPSHQVGTDFARGMFGLWAAEGYVERSRQVPRGGFTGRADYEFTLGGQVHTSSSAAMQIISGFTLLLVPTVFHVRMGMELSVVRRFDGRSFQAVASDSYRAVVWAPFAPMLWAMEHGQRKTESRLARHLFARLADQGAFEIEQVEDGDP